MKYENCHPRICLQTVLFFSFLLFTRNGLISEIYSSFRLQRYKTLDGLNFETITYGIHVLDAMGIFLNKQKVMYKLSASSITTPYKFLWTYGLSDIYKLVHFHFTRLQSYIYTAKACSTLTWVKGESQFNSNLSEETYLEGQWEHCNDDSYHRVEHEVKDVGDGPVCPSGESVLLHHYQVLLWLVLHQHRHVNLMRGEKEGGEMMTWKIWCFGSHRKSTGSKMFEA